MSELPTEQQLFYSPDGVKWLPSVYGELWLDEKCEGYLHKHLTWDEFQAIVNPPKSNDELFAEEFKARKAEYDADIQSLTLAMAGIILKDGPNEADKKAELQALEAATTEEYNQDIVTLRAKYYG